MAAIDDFLHRAVVSEVDDLGAGSLHDAPHDVDGRIVAVKQGGCRHDAYFIGRLVGLDFLHKTTGFAWYRIQQRM
jgi:hypothetical protein